MLKIIILRCIRLTSAPNSYGCRIK